MFATEHHTQLFIYGLMLVLNIEEVMNTSTMVKRSNQCILHRLFNFIVIFAHKLDNSCL